MADTSRTPQSNRTPTGVATAHVTKTQRPRALDLLEIFIGRWITEGSTTDDPTVQIVASDLYEWAPGGHVVIHAAYGHIGSIDVAGLEVIGHDPETGKYRTHFFDSQGNVIQETLSYQDRSWTWQAANVRCTGVFTEEGGFDKTGRRNRNGYLSRGGRCLCPGHLDFDDFGDAFAVPADG